MLLAVTNSYEGYNFVNTAMPPTNLTDYVTQLFPTIDDTTVQAIVQQYMDDTTLTNTSARAIAVMGECKWLQYYRSRGLKTMWRSSDLHMSELSAHGGVWSQRLQGLILLSLSVPRSQATFTRESSPSLPRTTVKTFNTTSQRTLRILPSFSPLTNLRF